jgi:tetratricopeptide (TPR) repeat protein
LNGGIVRLMAAERSHGKPARLVLIVASQCEALPALSFLPPKDYRPSHPRLNADDERIRSDFPLVFNLHLELTDPAAGGCVPVAGLDSIRDLPLAAPGLVINPTAATADSALEHAIAAAAAAEATLLVHYVGHGQEYLDPDEHPARRHFLLVTDTKRNPDDAALSTAWDPYSTIRDRRKRVEGSLAGLILVIDACQASAASAIVAEWNSATAKYRTMWIGSSALESAYDGCLTQTLASVLRTGIPAVRHHIGSLVTRLSGADIVPLVRTACPAQEPTLSGYQHDDPAMYIAANRAASHEIDYLGLSGIEAEVMLGLTERYVEHAIDAVTMAATHRFTVLSGEAGCGKSTLLAALRCSRPSSPDIIDALAMAGVLPTLAELVQSLHNQLATIPRFARAFAAFRQQQAAVWRSLDMTEQLLIGPLALFNQQVVIAIDGVDEVAPSFARAIWRLLGLLATHENLAHVHLIAATSSDEAPDNAHPLQLTPVPDAIAACYLKRRLLPDGPAEALVRICGGNFLMLRLAADYARAEFGAAWLLEAAEVGGDRRTITNVIVSAPDAVAMKAAISVLAAAVGNGPTLPFALFAHAVASLGGPATPAARYELLANARLQPLIGRSAPGTAAEHIGFVHPSLRQWLATIANVADGHAALWTAIQQLAPRTHADYSKPLHRYAASAEVVHAWHGGHPEEVAVTLRHRTFPAPRQTLAAWNEWNDIIQSDHRFTAVDRFMARSRIAVFTGMTGSLYEAAAQLEQLLQDSTLDADHEEVLRARLNLAHAMGQLHRHEEARHMFAALLDDHERVLGKTHRETLMVRLNLSYYTFKAGDLRTALELAQALLIDQRALGLDAKADTLINRGNIADWTGASGNPRKAERESAEIVAAWQRVQRRDDVDFLRARARHARWTAGIGNVDDARRMYRAVLADQEMLLGPEHPDTVLTRKELELT